MPDVSVFRDDFQIEQVLTKPPLICIEVLSSEDRRSRLQEKIDDCRTFGVPNIWVIDPESWSGWDASSGKWEKVARFQVEGTAVYVGLDELFASID